MKTLVGKSNSCKRIRYVFMHYIMVICNGLRNIVIALKLLCGKKYEGVVTASPYTAVLID